MTETPISRAAKTIYLAKRTIAFTGAGISVESGIPPFRGENGIWNKYDPIVLDMNYFRRHPAESWQVIKEIFYDFFGKARPNPAHEALARMEASGLLHGIITQNIDNLHQQAGSKNVIEFHGTSHRLTCLSCNRVFPYRPGLIAKLPPHCPKCGGLLRPDFIFFGEGIPADAYRRAVEATFSADVWLVIGTTGEIMPASLLPVDAKHNGASIIEVNIRPSNYTGQITDIFIQGKAGEILPALANELIHPG